MAEHAVAPHAASIVPARPPAPPPPKRDRGSFSAVDPLTQSEFWPRIKREREARARHVDDLNRYIDEVEASQRVLRKRCRRLEADGGASDTARARRLLRELLKRVRPDRQGEGATALDRAVVCATLAEALGVLGEAPPPPPRE